MCLYRYLVIISFVCMCVCVCFLAYHHFLIPCSISFYIIFTVSIWTKSTNRKQHTEHSKKTESMLTLQFILFFFCSLSLSRMVSGSRYVCIYTTPIQRLDTQGAWSVKRDAERIKCKNAKWQKEHTRTHNIRMGTDARSLPKSDCVMMMMM